MINLFAATADGSEVRPVPGFLAAAGVQRHNDVGTCTIRVPYSPLTARLLPKHPSPLRNLIVEDDGAHLHSGPITAAAFDIDEKTGAGLVGIDSESDNRWLRSRVTYPDPSRPATAQTTRTHDAHSGPASTVLYDLVRVHLGAGALAERRVPGGLALAPDVGIGGALSTSDRWRVLLSSMQRYALWANLAFAVRRGRDGVLTFIVWEPDDRRADVVLTPSRHTVKSATDRQSLPEATAIIGAGQGEGTSRVVLEVSDSAAAGAYGRVERFKDQRSEPDPAKQLVDLQADLAETRETRSVTVSPASTGRYRYGRDYGLGDWVTVGAIDGMTTAQQVREVKWSATNTGVEYDVLAGTPGESFTADDIIAGRVALSRVGQLEEAL